jgi:hypothetical protein
VSRNTGGNELFTLDLWRLTIGVGSMELIWSRSSSYNNCRVHGISAELGLVACCLDNFDNVDFLDLCSGVPKQRTKLKSLPVHTGPSIIHGTDLIVAGSDYEKWPSSHGLHCFNIQTGQHRLVDSASEGYRMFALAHHTDRIVSVQCAFERESAEVRNASQELATRSMLRQDAVLDSTLSIDGETLLVVFDDRFEVQTLQGDITFTRPAKWSGILGPQVSRSHDGASIATRTWTDTGAHWFTLWHVGTGTEVSRSCVTCGSVAPVFSHSTGLVAYDDEYGARLVVWDILGKAEILTLDFPAGNCISIFEDKLQFAQDDKTVYTSMGFFRIDNGSGAWTPWPKPVIPPKMSRSRISYRDEWVNYDREDLMWLPPHCRPTLEGNGGKYHCHTAEGTIAFWTPHRMVAMRIADPSR